MSRSCRKKLAILLDNEVLKKYNQLCGGDKVKVEITEKPDSKRTAGLCRLHKEAFGDSEEFVLKFMASSFFMAVAIATEDDEVIGAAYLVRPDSNEKVLYGYAVATLRSHRKKGVCREIHKSIFDLCDSEGYAYILHPATPELCSFYKNLGLSPLSYTYEVEIEGDGGRYYDISADEYIAVRRMMLDGIGWNPEWIRLAGYKTVGFDIDGISLAACISTNRIEEVLAPPHLEGAAARRAASVLGRGRLLCFTDNPIGSSVAVMGYNANSYKYFNLFME